VKVLDLGKHVGADAPVVTNVVGAKQSEVAFRFDLMPPLAMFALGEILKTGADKYGEENWRGIANPAEHLNHALVHAYSFLAGDDSEGSPLEHLARAFCRTAFALELEIIRLRESDNSLTKITHLLEPVTKTTRLIQE
jgi:hypothetical protein